MTPHDEPPTLTEEQLYLYEESPVCPGHDGRPIPNVTINDFVSMISELRRARARIAELEEEVETLREERDTFRYQALLARRQP